MKVYDWISVHNNRIPEKLAMIDWHSQRRFTYAQMNDRVAKFSGFLQHDLKVKKGDRVSILGMNSSDIFELQFACYRIGAIFVPLNIRLAVPELEYMINDLEANVLFCGNEFADAGAILKDKCNIKYLIDFNGTGKNSKFEDGLAEATPIYDMVEQSLEDICTILYTSGTTGRPKGACITHESVLIHTVNLGVPFRVTPDTVSMCILPMFHVSGLNIFGNPTFHAGGTNIIIRSIDPSLLLELINNKDLGVSHFIGVPTIFQFMAQDPEFKNTNFSRVISPVVGGAPATESLLTTCFDAGLKLCQGYGMTETGPTVLALDIEDAQRKIGAAGKPVMHVDLKVIKPDGELAKAEEVGEIWVKGPTIIPRYWKRPDANKTDFTDGWLHTGDAAYCDKEGDYFIVDRWKDMYISGGENVYPAEVENIISKLSQVMMVSVIGVPDEKWGETGAAFIVLKQDQILTSDQVISHCLENLAKYKSPKSVFFVSELPQNAAGKILKTELRKPQWQEIHS